MEEHEKHESPLGRQIAFTAVIGVLLLANAVGWFRTVWGWDTAILLTLIGGRKIFTEAFRGVIRRQISADLAVAIAAIAALCIKQYLAAAEVIFIMLIGESLESYAVDRTRGAIARLFALAPQEARVRRDGLEVVVPIAEVQPGDTVIVRPGERVPVDGVVTGGASSVDQSSMTGESMPVDKAPGDDVLTGTVNLAGALEIRAVAVGPDTKLAEIIHLVEEAEESKAPAQRRIDRYAKYFVPVVMTVAVLTFFVNRWLGRAATDAIIRAVSVLIVACPCALILATPTAVVAALGRLARGGILVKGGVYLEAAGEVDCVVFDKTGTLTRGEPRVAEIATFAGASETEVLTLAAAAEASSEHALGRLIVEEAARRGLRVGAAAEFTPVPGAGVQAVVDGERVLAGARKILDLHGVALAEEDAAAIDTLERKGYTLALVARGDRTIGAIAAEDTLRDESRAAVAGLREAGVRRILMLTGDNARAAARIARQADIKEFESDLLPAGKVETIRRLQAEGHKVAMLGDGVNDAPSLAAANVGVAMGGIGTDIAMEAADVVIMTDDVTRLAETIAISRRMLSTIMANIIWFAFAFNAMGVVAAATGYASPVAAAVLHQISSLLVCLNSLRLLIAGKFHETWPGRLIARVRAFFGADIPGAGSWAWAHRGGVSVVAAAVLLACYAASGFYAVQPGEVGVERRFGKVAQLAPPGLRYRLPWPLGRADRVSSERINTVEVGFRTAPLAVPTRSRLAPWLAKVSPALAARLTRGQAAPAPTGAAAAAALGAASVSGGEPAAYEWNTRHTIGRYEKLADEAAMLTGDENLIEATAVVQYTVADAAKYLLNVADERALMVACAESSVRRVFAHESLVAVLAADRRAVEREVAQRLQAALDRYHCGVRVEGVCLQDIHPPLEVVEDFRAVSSAFEEKHRVINEAQAYAAEKKELAKGQAREREEKALIYQIEKTNRAQGDAGKFERIEAAYAQAPAVTALRLFLEMAETALAPIQKTIVDQRRDGRNELFLFDEQAVNSALKTALQDLTNLAPGIEGAPPAE